MCLNILVRPEQQGTHPARPVSRLKPVLLFFIMLSALAHTGFAQNSDEINIRTIDMRGGNPVSASVAAIKNSRNHVVVVLMKGASEELINKTKDNLKALVHRGYDRIGIILCDFMPGETLPVIGIVSDGTVWAAIRGARPDARTMRDLYDSVSEVYQDTVLPILENNQSRKN